MLRGLCDSQKPKTEIQPGKGIGPAWFDLCVCGTVVVQGRGDGAHFLFNRISAIAPPKKQTKNDARGRDRVEKFT